ncbi:MAG TPA: 1-acyl-sn-glycerol-3-phosphate acyltransferase, partial [Rhodospirillales bacterium]|nr:1-acyl-sn-glycerol-3-phosphate acyltransferase [Rhodospirillales bacterium]
ARPVRWLRAIDRYRGSIAGGPNFAYELLLRHVRDEELKSLDLSCWRVAFNGAEPVAAATIERFCARFAAAGFRREAMSPVYGLAENGVGLAFPPLGRGPVIDRIDRDALARDGRAVSLPADDDRALRLVACGRPLAGNDIRVVDAAGFELPERHEGRLQFRGPSATRGYWRNEAATRLLLSGDWRETGDLAYVADGDLYITARIKDLIIRGGRNIHPADIEDGVGALDGILPGRVAAFGDVDPATGSERLIVLAETRKRDPQTLDTLRAAINGLVADLAGAPPDDVVLAPPNAIPRTSSGKVRRQASRALWRSGRIGADAAPAWQRQLRLAASTALGRARRGLRTAGGLLFAAWAWTALIALSPPAWLGVLLLPKPSWRWQAIHVCTRLLFHVTGTPLRVHGLEQLDHRPCVLVANHASYLDVLTIVAALPRPVAFVAKAELRSAWYTRLPMQRIGCCFVERFDRKQGLEDYRKIAAAARAGHSPLFFPEGTFRRTPGLMPFRMGAFACAVEAELPVIPVVLRGTRAILPAGSWFPRWARVDVTIAPPVTVADGEDRWPAALALRDRTRAAILTLVGERDAAEALPFAAPPLSASPAEDRG